MNNVTTRRRARPTPKGRQVDPEALSQVRAILGDAPRRRDLLIEHLHAINDHLGCLPAVHLAALAQEMKLALVEVYEVATFYAHFDVVEEPRPRRPVVRVCDSLTCAMMGGDKLRDELARALPDARVVRAPCMGGCHKAPVVHVGHHAIEPANVASVRAALNHAHHATPSYPDLATYRAAGGYRLLEDARAGRRTRDDLIALIEQSGLRGLGGAGFPTARKWKSVLSAPGPRLAALNADEGEPGTFKDRHCLESDPHRVLEGLALAAWVVEASEITIYLRDEYAEARSILTKEIAALAAAGLAPPIHLRRGAGAYICGEESAMLESIEGKRGLPRHKPPFPAQVGLFGRPTLIHNVETVFWLREIIERGPDWYSGHGRRDRKGLRFWSVSGRVRQPGVKLAPAGVSARELIEEFSGGMADGHRFAAYLPGGASGGILPASLGDLPLDFGTLDAHGCFVGSAAIVILSDQDAPRDAALNLLRFFEDESCGQCTPCRAGTEKLVKLMTRADWDQPLMTEIARAMADASICGLGQAAANPLLSLFRHFGGGR